MPRKPHGWKRRSRPVKLTSLSLRECRQHMNKLQRSFEEWQRSTESKFTERSSGSNIAALFRILGAACLIVLLILLTACSSVSPSRVPAPPNLTQPCDPIPPVTAKDLGELVQEFSELTAIYGNCAARHKALSDWARK